MNAEQDAGVERCAIGAFSGLATADALGTTLAFSPRDTRLLHTEIVGGGPFRLAPGVWTDDTQMALALAESLLSCGGLDERDLMCAGGARAPTRRPVTAST